MFDVEVENCGVSITSLKEPVISCGFMSWIEDWEKENGQYLVAFTNFQYINKYKDLVFKSPQYWACPTTFVKKTLHFVGSIVGAFKTFLTSL